MHNFLLWICIGILAIFMQQKLAWAQDKDGNIVDDPNGLHEIIPDLQHNGALMAGEAPSKKATAIQTDERGYVIPNPGATAYPWIAREEAPARHLAAEPRSCTLTISPGASVDHFTCPDKATPGAPDMQHCSYPSNSSTIRCW